MLMTINGYDISNHITQYSLTDSEPIVLNTIQMASGAIKKILAPYTQTVIEVELTWLTQEAYEAFLAALNANGEQTVVYYSEKTNATKTGTFFIDPTGYEIERFGNGMNYLTPLSLTLTRLDEVTA